MCERQTGADEYAIPQLGEGWTGDEALAIALYCTLRHLDSIDIADDLLEGCTISEYHSPSTPEEERWEMCYVKIEPANRCRKIIPCRME